MRILSSVLLSGTILLAPAAPSSSQQTATPASPSQATQSEPALKVYSRLVVVDVVVKKGETPVTGLQQSDFVIDEDGVPQTIRYFTSHLAPEAGVARAAAQPPALPPDTWTDVPIAPQSDSVTVLLADGLNTQTADLQKVRDAMIQYLKKQRSGTRMAVFALGGQLRLLQGFTGENSQLLAALKKASSTSPASLLAPDQQGVDEAQLLASMKQMGMGSLDLANTSNFLGEGDASQTATRVQLTLQAMQQLSRYLEGVPGRKNLIWFSGSFPLNFFAIEKVVMGEGPNPAVKAYVMPIRSSDRELRQTSDLLAAARIAVYPVDARGVLTQPVFAAASAPAATSPVDFTNSDSAMQNAGPQGGTVGSDMQIAPMQRMAEHNAMDLLAQQTGGRAVYESNGLEKAISDALSDGEDFYTLTYVSSNTNYNGTLRKIVVRVPEGKKDQLYYRRDYYADAGTQTQKEAQSGNAAFFAAMVRGVPSSSQIVFNVRLADSEPASGPVEGRVSDMKDRAARYNIDYAANVDTIDLPENAHGVRQGGLMALAIAYDPQGKPLNWVENPVPVSLDPTAWDQDSRQGLPIHQVLDLPAGAVELRVGLYDPLSGRIGSVEIPLHVVPSK